MDFEEMCFMDFEKIEILMDFKNVDLRKKKYISVKSF